VALPIALQSLIGSSLGLVDNLMVGSLGETAIAAVGAGIQPFFVFWMIMFGFSSGCATFMAQFWGTKDVKNIKKTLGFAITASSSIGLIFFIIAMFFPQIFVSIYTDNPEVKALAIDYVRAGAVCFLALGITVPITSCLRAVQQTRLPLYTSTFAFCMSTFLNYVFIFGNFGAPELGVFGAALATSIARVLELLVVLFVVFYNKNIISGKVREYFGWQKGFVPKVFNNAIPTAINETLWGVGTSLYVAAYARVGITAHAAVQLSVAINSVFVLAAYSIADAALILIGQRLGAGQLDYGYELGKRFLKISVVIGLVVGFALVVSARPIIGIFSEVTPEGQRYMFYILAVFGATMFLSLINSVNIVGILRAGGDTKYPMIVEGAVVWLIGVPLAFLSAVVLRLPIYLCVLLVRMEEFIKLFIFLKRFFLKKWVRKVTDDM